MNRTRIILITGFILLILHIETTSCQTTFIGYNTPLRYLPAQSEPDSNWFMPEFVDSAWISDTGTIGYGYPDVVIAVPTDTKSIYARYKFTVNNPGAVKEASFSPDFDDGYVAYLNGKEFIRRNVNDSVKFPAYNDVTYRSHESETIYPFPVLGYYLDSTKLDTLLTEGENTLAIHVLNDTLQGSDLYLYLRFFNLTHASYNMLSAPFRCKRQYMPDSFNLPLVLINTDEFGIPYKNIRVKAFIGIINNGEGNFTRPSDSCNVYYGDVSIEVHGNSSSEFPKRSYRFELIDSLENDSSVMLLGMPPDDDWLLYGPFQDKAQFRNPMMFDLARKFRRFQPHTRYCEVLLNGEYQGLYTLTETIKRAKDRIDIQKLKPDEISGNDVTGGYIMRYDKGKPGLQIVYPKKDNIQPEQIDYITDFMEEYRSVLFSNHFCDPANGYRKYMSDTTLVDHMIMTELMKNCDGYVMSTYFYKDRADKDNRVKYGPLWDNDLAFGNTIFQDGADPAGWHFEYNWPYDTELIHIKRFLQDTAFVHLFQNRWFDARQNFLQTDSIMNYIDSIVVFLHDAVERNYYLWPVIDKNIFNCNYISQSYDEEIYNIKNWLYDRLDWIDENIGNIYYNVDSATELPCLPNTNYLTLTVYPNPFVDELHILFQSSASISCSIEIFDINGSLHFLQNQQLDNGSTEIRLGVPEISNLPAGLYLLRVTLNNTTIITRKVIKIDAH
jgi:hypothetical protein